MFGVPDCGRVCSEQHLPGYLREAERFRALGISKILCVVVGDAAAAQEWARGLKVDPSKASTAAHLFPSPSLALAASCAAVARPTVAEHSRG